MLRARGHRLPWLGIGVALIVLLAFAVALKYARRDIGSPQAELATGGSQADPTIVVDLNDFGSVRAEAIRAASSLVERFPDSPDCLDVLGMAHFQFREMAEAVEVWNRLREVKPEFVLAYCRLAYVAMEKGDYAGAERLYREALSRAPTFVDARFGRAEALMQLGRLEEAIAILEPADADEDPRAVSMCVLRGQIYLELRDYSKAKEEYEAVIRIAPRTPQAYYGASVACARLGETEKAEEYRREFDQRKKLTKRSRDLAIGVEADLQRARSIAAATMNGVGECFLRRGDAEEAERNWRRAVEIDPENASFREQLAGLYIGQHRFVDAENELVQLMRLDPENLNGHLMMGKLQSEQGRREAAEESFREVIRLAPNRAAGYAALAHHLLISGESIPTACELAEKAVGLEPTAKHFYLLGMCASQNGCTDKAIQACERATALEPGNPVYRQAVERMRRR